VDIHLKQKALKHLARTEGEAVMGALNIEVEKISEVLSRENEYSTIEEQLDLLNTIAFRVHDKAISTLFELLNRIERIDFTFKDELGIPIVELRKYQNSTTLTVKILEILEHIRYFDIDRLLDLFLTYSVHDNEDIRKKAVACIDSIAEYNLDILYGSENSDAYGPAAQDAIIKKVNKLTKGQREHFFSSIISICRALLSSTVSGTSSTYKTVTWSTAPIQASDDFAGIRNSAIKILEQLCGDTSAVGQKLSVINTLYTVIHTPHRGKYSDELLELIYDNLLQVLAFYKKLLEREPLQIVQKIEHNCFWIFRHRSNDAVKEKILEIKDLIDANEEYQTYKILVGFEGIFEEWDTKEDSVEKNIEEERNYRTRKVFEFAESVNDENYNEWSQRIVLYAGTESVDLATFSYFGKFLERLGEVSPVLSIKLITENEITLERFFVALLIGVWKSDKPLARELISKWIKQSKYLFSCAALFEYNSDVDDELLNELFAKAVEEKDENVLIQILASLSANYDESNSTLVEMLFNSINELTILGVTNWINALWFRKEKSKILSNLDNVKIDVVLNNLLLIDSIEYHAEDILFPIAIDHPEKIVEFFGDRQKFKLNNNLGSNYDAIPFDFYELQKPLSRIPEKAVEIVASWYDGDYGMFIYYGANLLKIIFPDFPKPFEEKLIEVVRTGNKRNIDIVMTVLRNYDGQTFLHYICKELIINIPDDNDYISEIRVILDSTGVVHGEYGFANAFTKKKEEIGTWLEDENEKVRNFAIEYDDILEKRIKWETKRTDEDIELRKHKYGEN
jgi:hypothetical protein